MQELNLGKLIRYYFKNIWVVIGALLLGAGVGLFYSKNIVKPEYRSDSTVILNQHSGATDSTLINNYTTLLKSRKVLEPIIEKTGSNLSYSELHKNISIVNEKSTEIITISVTAPSPELAQNVNSSLIESFNIESLGLSVGTTESAEKIITVIDEASFSPNAINLKTSQNVAVMAGSGAVVAIVIMFIVFDVRNNRAVRRATPMFVNRRSSKMVGAITVDESPKIIAKEISKTEQKAREEQNSRIKMIKREATDILDVLENIGGVELTH